MRIPYVPNPPPTSTPDEAAIVSRVQARRAPRPLQPLDLALLHSPPVADGWNSFLGAVRTRTALPADLRELAIARVAVVNRAWYEWAHHAPLAVQAGVPAELLDGPGSAVASSEPLRLGDRDGDGDGAGKGKGKGFTRGQWAVLVYADEMTRNVEVGEETFAEVKSLFSEREVVEITATVSCLVLKGGLIKFHLISSLPFFTTEFSVLMRGCCPIGCLLQLREQISRRSRR